MGQAAFAFAIHRIGMGLSFLLNIGIGTVLGSLFPLWVKHSKSMSHGQWLTVLACLIITSGLLLCYWAGHLREHEFGEEGKVQLKPYLV